jgi:hypothetical protein
MEKLGTSSTLPTGSSSGLPTLTRPQTNPGYAAERAKILFGCYRRGEANDPDTYVAAITAVLAEYDLDVIKYVTDPRTGLPRKTNFLPTIPELDKACVEHANFVRSRDELIARGWRYENGQWVKPGEAA